MIEDNEDNYIQKIAVETEKKIVENQVNITPSTYEKMVNHLLDMLKNNMN